MSHFSSFVSHVKSIVEIEAVVRAGEFFAGNGWDLNPIFSGHRNSIDDIGEQLTNNMKIINSNLKKIG
jgi:hypothetical protein